MNKKQWNVFAIVFIILMILFIQLDSMRNSCIPAFTTGEPLSYSETWCIVNSEILDPFIYLFPILAIACWICSSLEK